MVRLFYVMAYPLCPLSISSPPLSRKQNRGLRAAGRMARGVGARLVLPP